MRFAESTMTGGGTSALSRGAHLIVGAAGSSAQAAVHFMVGAPTPFSRLRRPHFDNPYNHECDQRDDEEQKQDARGAGSLESR
jgi:hypothetical protein